MHALLAPWKNWNQRTDTNVGGGAAPNALNDCGPESAAEVVWYLTGVELEAEYILYEQYGVGYVGYTDIDHLTQFLIHRASATCIPYLGLSADGTRNRIIGALAQGQPWVQLFYFDTAGLTGGHFCPVVEVGDTHVVRSNPWTGLQETYLWPDFLRICQSAAFQVLRKRDPLLARPLVNGGS